MAQQFQILHGPSKWDLHTSLFPTDMGVSSPLILQTTLKTYPVNISLNRVMREDGSGESWLFNGVDADNVERVCSGYYSTANRRGVIRPEAELIEWLTDHDLEVVNGPSKWDLMIALFHGNSSHRYPVQFHVESFNSPVEAIINGVESEDESGYSWRILGYIRLPAESYSFQGRYTSLGRVGALALKQ